MRYLTVALAKGRLANKAMELFEAIGLSCEEMKDKGSRKLIFVNEELGIRFFLAKASDVPTYVEYGAADIGIVGKDTILEEGRKLYEVMDLGIGKCRMCVCGPDSAQGDAEAPTSSSGWPPSTRASLRTIFTTGNTRPWRSSSSTVPSSWRPLWACPR